METLTQAIVLGAWFGVVHAFDADHLATIGGLAVRDKLITPTGYAWRWALGHAAALGLVALAVLGFELTGVLDLGRYAEVLVATVLLAIGAQALRSAWRTARARYAPELQAHVASARPAHVHFLAPWHAHRGRTGVALGLLHGGAGSAAVLALLPLTQFHTAAASAIYLACFSLGVGLGAVAFAKVFTALSRRSARAGTRLAAALPAVVGVVALAAASLVLYETLHGSG